MKNGWKYHQPTAAQRTLIESVRKEYGKLNEVLESCCPAGRERALAITELEYSFLRAERAILLHEEAKADG